MRCNTHMLISHEELAELLSGHPQIKLAILFGFQAGGFPSADSDIGLVPLGDDSTYAKLLTRHLIDSADFLPLWERILAKRRKAWIGDVKCF